MANYKLRTQFNYGKYKGQRVSEVLLTEKGRMYLAWLHNSDKNVKLTDEVKSKMRELDIIENKE